jgi:hypothetical protein
MMLSVPFLCMLDCAAFISVFQKFLGGKTWRYIGEAPAHFPPILVDLD